MRTFHPTIVIYYILLAFILGIFGVNLIIAVEKVYYSQTMHKYLHEEHQIEEMDQQDRINLRLLKYYGIDKLHQQVFYKAHSNSEFNDQNQKRNTIKKLNLKKKKQYLSARQYREHEESVRISLGLKQGKRKTCFIFGQDKFRKLVYETEFEQRVLGANQLKSQDEQRFQMIQKFQHRIHSLSWQVIVKKDLEYFSSSEIDIFTDKSKNQQKMLRRQRELEFVSKMNPKQYYVIQQKDIDGQKKAYRNQLTYQSTKVFHQSNCRLPILKRNQSKPRQIKVQKADYSLYPGQLDNVIQNRQEYNDISAELNGVVNGVLYINGQEQNYKSTKGFINKKFKEHQNLDDNAEEELYIMFRKEECKQNAIVKHNWSGDDLKKIPMEIKVKLFKTLNKVDSIIWVAGLSGRYLVLQKNFVILLRKQSVSTFFDLIVLINVLLLCLEDLIDNPIIEQLNDACNILLVIEIIVKMISVGPIKYCYKFQNLFDFFFVSMIVSEVLIRFFVHDYSSLQTYLNIMRACQGILFYRVIKYYQFAVEMATISLKAFPSFFNLIILMVFVILVFALLGMDLFKDQFPEDIELSQQTAFDNLPKAFMVVFARSTMEDWYGLVLAVNNIQQSSKCQPHLLHSAHLFYILIDCWICYCYYTRGLFGILNPQRRR
ncbi:Sodium channel protein type 4 subunit alpha [Paramecium bursaria]